MLDESATVDKLLNWLTSVPLSSKLYDECNMENMGSPLFRFVKHNAPSWQSVQAMCSNEHPTS